MGGGNLDLYEGGLYGAHDDGANPTKLFAKSMAGYRTRKHCGLTPGSVLSTPIFDEHLNKLLDADATVDEQLMNRLHGQVDHRSHGR